MQAIMLGNRPVENDSAPVLPQNSGTGASVTVERESITQCRPCSSEGKGILPAGNQGIPQRQTKLTEEIYWEGKTQPLLWGESAKNWAGSCPDIVSSGRVKSFPGWSGIGENLWPDLGANSGITGILWSDIGHFAPVSRGLATLLPEGTNKNVTYDP